MGWADKIVEKLGKNVLINLGRSMGGEVVQACGDAFERSRAIKGFPNIFLGKQITDSVIDTLSTYEGTLSSYPRVLSNYVRVTKKYIDKVVDPLKKYKKELETFRNTSSTLNDIESSKKEMRKIVSDLKDRTVEVVACDSTAEKITKSPTIPSNMEITQYLIGDFASEFLPILIYTLAHFDEVIILSDDPVIDYDALQIKGDKNKRKETLQANVKAKRKKDAEAARKKIDDYFKEAKKIHDKLKSAYDSMLKTYNDFEKKSTVFTQNDIEETEWKLQVFNNNVLVPLCKLIGLGCCKFIFGEGFSKSEVQKIEEELRKKQGMSIVEIANDIRIDILQGHYLEAPHKVQRVPEALKRLEEVKKLERESPRLIKEIRGLLGKIDKTLKAQKAK